MKYEQDLLDTYLHCILNGFSPFVNQGSLYLAKHLCSKDIFESNCHTFVKKEEYRTAGLATEYDILQKSKERGLWTWENDQKILLLERQIKEKRDIIPKILMPSQVKHVEGEISALLGQLSEIKSNKESLLFYSLEREILREKRDYLAYLGLRSQDGNKLWNSYQEYLNSDGHFIDQITNEYYTAIHELNSSVIRAVARQTDARYRIKICSTPEVNNISIILCELRQWCDFYTSIHELSDKPVDDVILDDDKLDKWLLGRKLRNESEKSVNSGNGERGFTGIVGTKEDMEFLGATPNDMVLALSKNKEVKTNG